MVGVGEVRDRARATVAFCHPAEPRGGDIETVIAKIPGDAQRASSQPQLAERDQPDSAAGLPETVDV